MKNKTDGYATDGYIRDRYDANLLLMRFNSDGYNSSPSPQNLDAWRQVFEEAQNDKDFKIFTHERQINIKLTDKDMKSISEINKHFFEDEASNSMLGRILLRKGIAWYKKIKEST